MRVRDTQASLTPGYRPDRERTDEIENLLRQIRTVLTSSSYALAYLLDQPIPCKEEQRNYMSRRTRNSMSKRTRKLFLELDNRARLVCKRKEKKAIKATTASPRILYSTQFLSG